MESETDTDTKPVLSIFRFVFKDINSFLDPRQPDRKLWNANLEYIWSIPGCLAICWGHTVDKPEIIICLIQWESKASWDSFEWSFGFGHLIGMLDQAPSAHNMNTWVLDYLHNSSFLEIRFLAFGAADLSADFRRSFLSERLAQQEAFRPLGSTDFHAGWSRTGRTGPFTYTEFYVHARSTTDQRLPTQHVTHVRDHNSEIRVQTMNACLELVREVRPCTSGEKYSQPTADSVSSLMKIEPVRQYQDENEALKGMTNSIVEKSMASYGYVRPDQADQGYPAPDGYHMPWKRHTQGAKYMIYHPHVSFPPTEDKILDILCINFTAGTEPLGYNTLASMSFFPPGPELFSPAWKSFSKLRMDLRTTAHCEHLLWGVYDQCSSKVAMFIRMLSLELCNCVV
jgi:hypothetical protein